MRAALIALAAFAALAQAAPARAEPGDILIKLRGGYALHSGGDRTVVDVGTTPVAVKADGGLSGEASLTFFLTNQIAMEFAIGGQSYDLGDRSGKTLVSAGLVTPMAVLQYHFLPQGQRVRPYAGIGAAYANFYSEQPGEILTDRTLLPPVTFSATLKGAIAPVGQLGADIALNDRFYLNLDAKYLAASSRLAITQGGNRQTVRHDMRSAVIAAGVGFRF